MGAVRIGSARRTSTETNSPYGGMQETTPPTELTHHTDCFTLGSLNIQRRFDDDPDHFATPITNSNLHRGQATCRIPVNISDQSNNPDVDEGNAGTGRCAHIR